MTGFEPATAGATVRSSTPELHPPSRAGNTTLYLDCSAEGTGPPVVGQVRFQFCLPLRQGRRIVKMLDLLAAIRLNDDQLEANAAGGGSRLTPDERALPFVKPHHLVTTVPEGPSLPQGSPSLT